MNKKEQVMQYLNTHREITETNKFNDVTAILAKELNMSQATARNYYAYWKSNNTEEERELDVAAEKIVDILMENGKEKREKFKSDMLEEINNNLNDSIGKQDHKEEVKKGPKKVVNTLRIKSLEGEYAEYQLTKDGVEARKSNQIICYRSVEEVEKAVKETIEAIKAEGNEIIEVFKVREAYE